MSGPTLTGVWEYKILRQRICLATINFMQVTLIKIQYTDSRLKFTLKIHQSSDNTAGRPHQLKQKASSPQVCVLTTQPLE